MKTAYLLKVDELSNNNKYYQMIEQDDGNFKAMYGRVGATPMTIKRPMSLWNETYQSKIAKGYIDRSTHMSVTEHSQLRPIDEISSRKFFDYILSCSSRKIRNNYSISISDISLAAVDEAQNMIFGISHISELSDFNESLKKLFLIIPRKMKQVQDNLAISVQDFNSILEREQELLDVLRARVSEHQKTEGEKTLLEKYGLLCKQVRDTETLGNILKHMSAETSYLFRRAFIVRNLKREKAFREYCSDNRIQGKNIRFLYHGSANANIWGLIKDGPMLNPKAPINGKMFGQGLYYAPRAKKSVGYTSIKGAHWVNGDEKTGFLMVFKVAYKNPMHIKKWESNMTDFNKDKIRPYDAVYAHKGISLYNDEIIIYDENQVMLEYVIELGC